MAREINHDYYCTFTNMLNIFISSFSQTLASTLPFHFFVVVIFPCYSESVISHLWGKI